jgi:thymidylate synthase ThyX
MAKTLKEHNFFGFDATIVADSINGELQKEGITCRGTTMVVTFPRIVLAEFNTHRMFSRNSASSRAIPFNKIVERVQQNPFIPIAFQKEHKGMQGTEYLSNLQESYSVNDIVIKVSEHDAAVRSWLNAKDDAIKNAFVLNTIGATKQLANRLLEPFLWHTVIVSATEWENFFELRCPQYGGTHERLGEVKYRSRKDCIKAMKDVGVNTSIIEMSSTLEWLKVNQSHADIHISLAAEAMWDAYNKSIPKVLKGGEWHIPFEEEVDYMKAVYAAVDTKNAIGTGSPEEDVDECMKLSYENVINKISVATCGRISYGNISPAESDYVKDIEMYERLKSNRHSSPFEHVFQAMTTEQYYRHFRGAKEEGTYYFEDNNDSQFGWSHNLHGFISERTKLGI